MCTYPEEEGEHDRNEHWLARGAADASLRATRRGGKALQPLGAARRGTTRLGLLPGRLVTVLQWAVGQLRQGLRRVQQTRGEARSHKRRPPESQRCDGGEARSPLPPAQRS